MTLSYFKVIRVMCRCDLYNTCSEFHINIAVFYNRDRLIHDRKPDLSAMQIRISFISRIDSNCCIAQHCLRSCRCELKEFCLTRLSVFIYERIFNMPEMSLLLFILYFRIGNGSIADRTPVYDTGTLVDPAFFMHLTENFRNCFITAFIHGKSFSVPVTGRTHLLQLFNDTSAIFLFPVPGTCQKAFTSEVFFINAFFFQLFNDLNLCCNGGMICTGLP